MNTTLHRSIVAAVVFLAFGVGVLGLAGSAHAAAQWLSPSDNATYSIGGSVSYDWTQISNTNYIRFVYLNGSWGSWINRGGLSDYSLNTGGWSQGWLAAQVATLHGSNWQYTVLKWIYLQPPPPPA